jgi:hypothetical protein
VTIWMRPAAAVGVLSRFVLSVARPSGSEPLDPPLPAYNLPPRPSTCATHHPNSRSFGPTSRGPATILAPIRPNSSRRRPSIGCEPDPPARRLLRRVFSFSDAAPKATQPPGRRRALCEAARQCAAGYRRASPFLRCEGWLARETRAEPEKDKDAAILDCALGNRPSTGTNGGAVGGRLSQQRGRHSLVPVGGAAEAKREPRDLPGRPRGSPASQGDDSASDFDPQGRTGPRYDRGEFVQPSQPNVADSREDRRKRSGPIRQPPPRAKRGVAT